MTTAIDTNVFSIIWLGDALAEEARQALLECSAQGSLAISAIVYAEMLAKPMIEPGEASRFLSESSIRIDFRLREEVWSESGKRFGEYARRKRQAGGGEPRRLIADFVVGAHALFQADRLLTFDRGHFRTAFPELRLVR